MMIIATMTMIVTRTMVPLLHDGDDGSGNDNDRNKDDDTLFHDGNDGSGNMHACGLFVFL